MVDREAVTRVVLAAGKVALDAVAHRDQRGLPAAVVRVEQLYPWPGLLILDTLSRYPNATEVVWLQEEPENMGGWSFVSGRLARLLPAGVQAPPRQPHGVGQPRERQPHGPSARAGGPPRAHVCRPVGLDHRSTCTRMLD